MTRVYFIQDAQGDRRIRETDFPLAAGGSLHGGLVLPDVAADALIAVIAFSEGHAYVQPADGVTDLFHNDERLTSSAWLKSGDRIEYGEAVFTWDMQGERVFIRASIRNSTPAPVPPGVPRPAEEAGENTLPVVEAPVRSPTGMRLRNTLITAFSLLLLVVGYLLASIPVDIRITPEPQEVQLDGFPPPLFVSRRPLVLPGSYRLRASLAGYQPLDVRIDAAYGESQPFEYHLQELPGRLHIQTSPQVPYELFVDDVRHALDDGSVAYLGRGEHRIRLVSEHYLDVEQAIDIEGFGREQAMSVEFQPAWADVLIESDPSGARVSIDGDQRGETPLQAQIMQGQRRIELSLAGYKSILVNRHFQAGEQLALDRFELQPADGELVIDTQPSGVTVIIDDRFYGTTPISVNIESGTMHQIRLGKAGYHQERRQLQLAADEQRHLSVNLAPQLATVLVSTTPGDARLSVDGKEIESGKRRLRLTTRSHTFTAEKPGYIPQTVKVTPRAGVTESLSVVLKRRTAGPDKKGAVPTELPATMLTPAGQLLRLVQPSGEFLMGASRREAGRRANESRRRVSLKRAFYFGEKEVTNAGYRRFRPAHDSGMLDGVSLNSDRQPVVNVSWDDAARYCNWLSKQQGLPAAYREVDGRMQRVSPANTGYRLPTEAEWAYVARALGRTKPARYPWSGSFPPGQASGNYADRTIADTLADTVPGYDDGYRGTAPAGSFAAFPPGFYDLGGNVAEWTDDFYAVYPGEEARLAVDPHGPVTGEHHVVRGSGWRHGNITELRLSYRDYSKKPRYDLGFRIARYAY